MSTNQDRGMNRNEGVSITSTDIDICSKIMESLGSTLDDKLSSLKSYIVTVMRESIEVVKEEILNLQKSFNFLSSEYDDLKKDNSEQKQLVLDLKRDNSTLTKKYNDMAVKLQSIEQISRSYNIEVQGVPEKKEENVVGIVKKIYEVTTGEMMPDETIMSCRRVAKMDPTSPRPRNILLTLPSPRHRDSMLSAVHRFNKANPSDKLNSHSIGMSGEKCPIYTVEHLPSETKSLQAEARKLAKENNYTFVWVKYGKVFVRKCEKSKAIMVKNEQSLKLIT